MSKGPPIPTFAAFGVRMGRVKVGDDAMMMMLHIAAAS